MEFSIKNGNPAKARAGCVVVGVFEGRRLSASAQQLDSAARKRISEVLRSGDLEGKLATTLLLHKLPGLSAERVLLVGLGRERDFVESAYRTALVATIKALRGTGATEAVVCLPALDVKRRDTSWKVEQAVLCLMEGMYRFDRLKSKAPEARRSLKKIVLMVADKDEVTAAESAVDRGVAIAEGMALAKDLGNLPGNVCTPTYLAEQAVELGKRHGIRV